MTRTAARAMLALVTVACQPHSRPTGATPKLPHATVIPGTVPAVAASVATAASPAASGTPALSSSASVPPSNQPDPKTFTCVGTRCNSGKETCCAHGGIRGEGGECIAGPAAGARERDLAAIYSLECKVPRDQVAPGDLTTLRAVRCDESQDCDDQQVCCRVTEDDPYAHPGNAQITAVRCLAIPGGPPPRPIGRSKVNTVAVEAHKSPCPGDELCIAGGPPCRTPGAQCVDGFCKKLVDRACASAADCLDGQRCVRTERGLECSRHPPTDPCGGDADCAAICGDKRATCRPHATMPELKLCKCP